MTNFGLFSGDDELGGAVARRLYEKVDRAARQEAGHLRVRPRLPLDPLRGAELGQVSTCPSRWRVRCITMLRYIKEGRIKVDKTRNTDAGDVPRLVQQRPELRPVRGAARAARLVVTDFREMYPNRAENYCCTGGGGAMSMSEYTPRRLKSGEGQGRPAHGHRREDRRHLVPQLRRRPDRPDPALQARHAGHAARQSRGQRPA